MASTAANCVQSDRFRVLPIWLAGVRRLSPTGFWGGFMPSAGLGAALRTAPIEAKEEW
jgi:hypothetical protein